MIEATKFKVFEGLGPNHAPEVQPQIMLSLYVSRFTVYHHFRNHHKVPLPMLSASTASYRTRILGPMRGTFASSIWRLMAVFAMGIRGSRIASEDANKSDARVPPVSLFLVDHPSVSLVWYQRTRRVLKVGLFASRRHEIFDQHTYITVRSTDRMGLYPLHSMLPSRSVLPLVRIGTYVPGRNVQPYNSSRSSTCRR